MRRLVSAVAIVGIVTLTACSSGTKGNGSTSGSTPTTAVATDTGSPSTTGSSGSTPTLTGQANGTLCLRLKAVTEQFSSLSTAMADPQSAAAALKQFIAVLKEVGSGAPPDVAKAVDELITAVSAAVQAMSDPAHFDTSKLQQLAPKLAADAATISAYVAASCGAN